MTLSKLKKRFPGAAILASPPEQGPYSHGLYFNTSEVEGVQPASIHEAKNKLKDFGHYIGGTIKIFKKGE